MGAGDLRRTPVTLPLLGEAAGAVAPREPLAKLGRYELLSLLAKGGMGEVYLARSRGLGGFEKLVVIKRNLASMVRDDEPLLAEARLVGTLQHTNIVQVYDIGIEGGTVFLAMEFLHGQDVRNVLRRAWSLREQVPLDQAVATALSVCAGLHYAHDKRDTDGMVLEIVHRDVSPSNVFVTYDGGIKLIDFGIAKATSLPSETQLGTVKGKPGYMSPEQCRGEPLDRRSDLFCVGILLYEMTTGVQPFRGQTEYATYQAICDGPVRPPTAIAAAYPPELEAIVLRALAKDRRDRQPTALALQEELAAFATRHRLDVSQHAYGRYVSELFRDELAAWREAQRSGQSLIAHVVNKASASVPALVEATRPVANPGAAMAEAEPGPDPESTTAATPSSAMITTPVIDALPRSRRRGALIAISAAAAVAVAIGIVIARGDQSTRPHTVPPAASSNAAPTIVPAAPTIVPVPPAPVPAAAPVPAPAGGPEVTSAPAFASDPASSKKSSRGSSRKPVRAKPPTPPPSRDAVPPPPAPAPTRGPDDLKE